MRGAQFSATLNNEKCSDLCELKATTSVRCQGGFALVLAIVLYCLYGRDHLWGSKASKSIAQPFGRCSLIFPFENSGTLQALKESMACVLPWCEGNPVDVAEQYMCKVWNWV